jgi:hypothetical protein
MTPIEAPNPWVKSCNCDWQSAKNSGLVGSSIDEMLRSFYFCEENLKIIDPDGLTSIGNKGKLMDGYKDASFQYNLLQISGSLS